MVVVVVVVVVVRALCQWGGGGVSVLCSQAGSFQGLSLACTARSYMFIELGRSRIVPDSSWVQSCISVVLTVQQEPWIVPFVVW
jgi:hypothetical protein